MEPHEIVCVDNGSPADVAAYLDAEAKRDPNFILVRNKSNLGIGVAMNQAMRKCRTDYILRADSDVVLQTPYGTRLMRELLDAHPEVGAVGTSITGGNFIQRDGYIETDICLSNCMLIARRTIVAIDQKMKAELPRVRKVIAEKIANDPPKYVDYFKHMGEMLDYMANDGGYWTRAMFYGADDFFYSMLIRYAGLRITRHPLVHVYHKDASLSPENPAGRDMDRDRKVREGFQYWRTFFEILCDDYFTGPLDYGSWKMNKQYIEEGQA
jgi:glycosyltransferase involved in cell wall biosynthesis